MVQGLADDGLDLVSGRFADAAQSQAQHAEFFPFRPVRELSVFHNYLRSACFQACFFVCGIIIYHEVHFRSRGIFQFSAIVSPLVQQCQQVLLGHIQDARVLGPGDGVHQRRLFLLQFQDFLLNGPLGDEFVDLHMGPVRGLVLAPPGSTRGRNG